MLKKIKVFNPDYEPSTFGGPAIPIVMVLQSDYAFW